MSVRFRFTWVPFLATLVVMTTGIALGQWQTRRAAEKEAIEAKLTEREKAPPVVLDGTRSFLSEELEYRQAIVRGEFVPAWPVYLDNRPFQGQAGFYVLMPLKISGSDTHVLVARGWVRRELADRTRIPVIPTQAGIVEIRGMIKRGPGHLLQLGTPEPIHPGAIVQNADVADFARASRLPLQPFIIEQENDTGDGLIRDWPRASLGADRHRGYAFQWYALAATAFVFFVVTGIRRGKKSTLP